MMEKYPAPKMDTESNVIAERLGAFILDTIIVIVGMVLVIWIGFALGEAVGRLLLLVAVVGAFLYKIVFEGLYGYTPGKAVVGLVVVKSDGSNCTMGASIIRNLLLFIDELPFLYILGIILILFTDHNQRIGDLVGDTVVVKQQ